MATLIRIRAADGISHTFKDTPGGLREAKVKAQEIADSLGESVEIQRISGRVAAGELKRQSANECGCEAEEDTACECCGETSASEDGTGCECCGETRKASRKVKRNKAREAEACAPLPSKRKLSRAQRNRLAKKRGGCAIVETTKSGRKICHFPLSDAAHARRAIQSLTRVAGRHGPHPSTARKVLAAVKKEFPEVLRCYPELVADAKKANKV